MKARHVTRIASSLVLASCARHPAKTVGRTDLDLVTPFAAAAEAEQTQGSEKAIAGYLALVDLATANPGAPRALETLLASVDALALRSTPGLDRVGAEASLAFRHPKGMDRTLEGLAEAYDQAASAGPFARGVVAEAALALALYRGDAPLAQRWRGRTGCAREAAVVGPLDWTPVTATARPTPLEAPLGKLAASYPGIAPFSKSVPPMVAAAEDCSIPLRTTSTLEGLRAVVVDVDVPRSETIGIAVESSSAAVVVVGGKVAVTRPYELGGARLLRWGTAEVPKGRVRVVARVGNNGEGSRVTLHFFGDDGLPLTSHAPTPGQAATVAANRAAPWTFGTVIRNENERALLAAAWLAQGDGRSAEHLLEEKPPESAAQKTAAKWPLSSLVYTRAVDQADDLPENRAVERARDAYEDTLKAWPTSWEAILGHAQLTGRRRGAAEGRLEALGEIAAARQAHPGLDPIVRGFEAASASEGKLYDIAEQAFTDLAELAPETPLVAQLDGTVHDRVGAEREQYACRTPALDRNAMECLDAKVAGGDRRGALAEIARVRALRGSPTALRSLEIAQYIALGDEAGTMRVYGTMLPAERSLAALGLLLPSSPANLRARMLGDMLAATDAPGSLGPLYTALLDSPARAFEAESAARVAADRKSRTLSTAGTAVLKHSEHYVIGDGGLLRYTLLDLRRVSGTTDVAQGAQAYGALIDGRDLRRTLRRRIYKTDGRVLEPDRASYASQEHSDLSQLEKGDYVEQIVDGWALPGASGQLVVDTPDLLPERTSIDDAVIEVRRPADLPLAMWSHALLGKPVERTDGGQKVTTFVLKQAPPRRLEEGVPKMDRDVGVSFGTSSWRIVGQSIAEAITVLEDHDPFVTRWAQAAAAPPKNAAPGAPGTGTDEVAVVDRIVAASGKAVKVASGAVLTDSAAALAGGGQGSTARTMLELSQGSRTWLAYRALRQAGIAAEIVIAEREPFSADPTFPPHFGRFDYPLVIAHLKSGDLWLDLDVQGPPLPAGHISPELRGRMCMNAAGTLSRAPGGSGEGAEDEVDIRLKLDAKGDADGTFTVLLRGRTAQVLADALEQVVGSDRRDMLRGVVLGWLPWANVNEVALSSSEGAWQVSLRAQVSIPSYAQAEGATWVLPGLEPLHVMYPRSGVGTLGATFASQGDRESALAIDSAFQYHVHRRVELGAGAKLARPLPSVEVSDEYLRASRKSKLMGNVLDEDFALAIPTGTLDPATYKDFASKAHSVDDGFQAASRVAK